MQEHAAELEEWFAPETRETFEQRITEQTAFLKEEARSGAWDNEDFTLGLELEVYAVDDDGHIVPIPDDVLADAPFNPELGLQNAEFNTAPTLFGPDGAAQQAASLEQQFADGDAFLEAHGYRLVLDAIWTLHPEADTFLSEQEEVNGFRFPVNMRTATRYHALDNAVTRQRGGQIPLDVPGADHGLPSILFECLATSIQPHLQVPETGEAPAYFNLATRSMAPMLALTTNSPFLPPDLYNKVDDPEALLAETYHELRVPIFEQAVNTADGYEQQKVRVPRDIDAAEDVVDLVAEDRTLAPALSEWKDDPDIGYRDSFWEWDFKRKTFWRWIRPVIGAEPVTGGNDEAAFRIEYRPLPTQPTLRDTIAVQVATAGLVHGLVVTDHPVRELDWETARDGFYAVVEDGLDASFMWITAEGEETTDTGRIVEDVLAAAEAGLADRGFSSQQQRYYLDPLRARWQQRTTPSMWKIEQVRERLAGGDSLPAAINAMQREYIERTRQTDCFTEWI
ncbi:MAG: hypothetical protein SVW77_04055 [Candidatus Nanohaloarchaea archaeon]|nr:hypothetical protein [Candidatus Nanohaloarchaea archaeon]